MARNEDKLKAVVAELPSNDQCHSYIVADFTKPEELREKLDIMVDVYNKYFDDEEYKRLVDKIKR